MRTTPTFYENIVEALDAAFEAGRRQGRGEVAQINPRSQANLEALEAQLKLVNAVGQAMDVQSRLLTGLAQALDNVRVL